MFQSLFDLMEQAGRFAASLPALSFPALSLPALASDLPSLSEPSLELTDNGGALVVRIALQGVDPKTVQVEANDTTLAIGGRSTREEETEGPDFHRVVAQSSHFFRQVPLPVPVDPARSSAQWQGDGALLVILPKR